MMLDILRNASVTWREIVKLATPLDSDKPVFIGANPKSPADFEAYTDNQKIYINLNNEAKFQKDLESIVVPAYKVAAHKLYDVTKAVSDPELVANLAFDTFLFIHFHEQLHPWLCPNSKFDEQSITKALFEGIMKAEPGLSKGEAMVKTNNCKNLIWDTVLNISFISKTSGYNNENLEQKISYVFVKNGRQIEYQPVTKYPAGILPVAYIMSAQNRPLTSPYP